MLTPGADSRVPVLDVVKALAFVGDLSMGQPVDHSARTAWLAARIADALSLGAEVQTNASYVALLRWSGCTANAPEFSELLGDDVGARNAMLSDGFAPPSACSIRLLTEIHCEVSGDIARTLGMPPAIELPLRRVFENVDGSGKPDGLSGEDVPIEVCIVAAASDIEIFSRVYDLTRALQFSGDRSGRRYPPSIVGVLRRHAADWLHTLERGAASVDDVPVSPPPDSTTPLELVADVIDLKLPWMTGYSRRVADVAASCGAQLGLDEATQWRIRRAGLIHGIGRASVPNAIWNESQPPTESAQERLRLVPYWTARAGRRMGSLAREAELASFIDERLDGSGYFRGAIGAAISHEARVLGAAAQYVLLQTDRPGRSALNVDEALEVLRSEADSGRLDEAVVASLSGATLPRIGHAGGAVLTVREIDVLRRISHGESNKEAGRTLGISPSTVRAHLESVFRKLECSTRAAATLKALTTGLL